MTAPALIVTLPLTGFALQGDERRALVRAARAFGSNPLAVAESAVDTVELFLRAGNFRPLGRFAEKAEQAFLVEAAEATGLSLHSLQGTMRMVGVAALAMTAAGVVAAVMRSAGVGSLGRPLLLQYSLALGATLVASHHLSPLTAFPVAFVGSPLLILAVALAVARDADMEPRRLAWHERVAMLALVRPRQWFTTSFTWPLRWPLRLSSCERPQPGATSDTCLAQRLCGGGRRWLLASSPSSSRPGSR